MDRVIVSSIKTVFPVFSVFQYLKYLFLKDLHKNGLKTGF